ncbi:MAG: DUF1549 domain-containing protein [Pirellulaceae bacterium]
MASPPTVLFRLCIACVLSHGLNVAFDNSVVGQSSLDQIVVRNAQRDGIQLTEAVSDDQYLRRASLDLIGRIPTPDEQAAFASDPDRRQLIERLVRDPNHALFWSRMWTDILIGYGDRREVDRESLRQWLADRIANDLPWNSTVSELISSSGRGAFHGPANFMLRHLSDPVVPVARLFLGVQLDCARCHDHPSDRWTEEVYRNMHRFFAATQSSEPVPGTYLIGDRRPNRNEAPPRFLTGSRPRTSLWREELALFVVNSRPFARSVAGRLWYQFFGHVPGGSPDNVNARNAHDCSELIECVADHLRDDDFRWRSLIREICLSEAYRRRVSSTDPDWPLIPTVKPLTADQLYDSSMIVFDGDAWPSISRSELVSQMVAGSREQAIGDPWKVREPLQSLMSRLSIDMRATNSSVDDVFRRVLCREPTDAERKLARDCGAEELMYALVFGNEFAFWH